MSKMLQLQQLLTKLGADDLALVICTNQKECEANARKLVLDFACRTLDGATVVTPNGGVAAFVLGTKNVHGLRPTYYTFDHAFRFETDKQLHATLDMREYLENIGTERL